MESHNRVRPDGTGCIEEDLKSALFFLKKGVARKKLDVDKLLIVLFYKHRVLLESGSSWLSTTLFVTLSKVCFSPYLLVLVLSSIRDEIAQHPLPYSRKEQFNRIFFCF